MSSPFHKDLPPEDKVSAAWWKRRPVDFDSDLDHTPVAVPVKSPRVVKPFRASNQKEQP